MRYARLSWIPSLLGQNCIQIGSAPGEPLGESINLSGIFNIPTHRFFLQTAPRIQDVYRQSRLISELQQLRDLMLLSSCPVTETVSGDWWLVFYFCKGLGKVEGQD